MRFKDTCDSCETMLQGNSDFFENLYKKDKNLAKSFVDAIKRLVEKIKSFVTERHADTEYGKALLKVADDLYNQVQQLWNEAVESGLEAANVQKADNKKAANEGGVKKQDRKVPYTYENLVAKPDMEITEVDDSKEYTPNAQTRKDIVEQAIKNAAVVGKYDEEGHAIVSVDDINSEVMLPKTALRHGLDRRLNINAPVVLKAGEILKNAIAINELVPRNIETSNTFTLVGIAKNQRNEPYTVTFVVNRSTNEVMSMDVLYSINTKTEPAGSLSPGAYANARYLTGSNISIADLLDYVNKYFPDILPESVLKHYGYDSRPEGKIGESALYQDRTTDTDYLSAVERGDMETAQRMVDEAQLKKAAAGNACDSFCNYSAILISTGNQINLLR